MFESARRPLTDVLTPPAVFASAMLSHSQEPGSFFLAKLLGFEVSYAEDACLVEFSAHEYLLNTGGVLLGGVAATALDVSMEHLIQRLYGAATTVDLHVQYLRTVSSGRLCCEARVPRRGRRLWFVESRLSSEDGALIACRTCTMIPAAPSERPWQL